MIVRVVVDLTISDDINYDLDDVRTMLDGTLSALIETYAIDMYDITNLSVVDKEG